MEPCVHDSLFKWHKDGLSSRAMERVQVMLRNMQCRLMYCGARQLASVKQTNSQMESPLEALLGPKGDSFKKAQMEEWEQEAHASEGQAGFIRERGVRPLDTCVER